MPLQVYFSIATYEKKPLTTANLLSMEGVSCDNAASDPYCPSATSTQKTTQFLRKSSIQLTSVLVL